MTNFLEKILKKEDIPRIQRRSNIIQFDDMGYPLRLCTMSDGEQQWVDTYEEDEDVVLEWK
ncbi:hypothetical protein [Tetragenococcus halophilus]|uniref:hypothetical protein n=1 Tax=Tetragenococcus halophilus TaxID=51669 RepID=UPI0030100B2D